MAQVDRIARDQPILSPRRVNLLLEILVVLAIGSGVGSWLVPLGSARPFTVVHGIAAFGLVVLTPFKIRGSVRVGIRRNAISRWLSMTFGLLILGAALFGFLHTSGVWHGVGEWSALWTHHLLGFAAAPLFIWHLWARRPASPVARARSSAPVPPTKVDLERRTFLAGGAVTASAGLLVLGVEAGSRIIGSFDGRAGTGSREVGSFDPDAMPSTVWINDRTPSDTDPSTWTLLAGGEAVDIEALVAAATPLTAALDCTGGWWSNQHWDVVPLAAVLAPVDDARETARSVRVTSATSYQRLFAVDDAATDVFLAVGYDGRPLDSLHGAPVRVVAPGRRGPWWVKWVTEVAYSSRPTWRQLPLPRT